MADAGVSAVPAPVCGNDNVHAGIAVLTNSALWSAITACMTGYPLVVRSVCTDAGARALLDFGDRWAIQSQLAGDTLVDRGVLVHLTIAAGSLDALNVLHALRTHFEHYRRSAELALDQVMRCAVLFSRVDVLEWFAERQAVDAASWPCEPNLLVLAVRNARDTTVGVLEWIHVHAPHETRVLLPVYMHLCVREGRLDMVQWLHAHGCAITQKALHEAAENGHVRVLEYLYDHTDLRCTAVGVNNTARNGHLDVIKLLVAAQDDASTARGLDFAAQHGHLAIVQFLLAHNTQVDVTRVLDFAARSGSLALVEYLHALFPASGCTTQAMDSAAAFGHLEVVKFLHEHRREGCSSSALTLAAHYGHLEVVEFLCARRSEGDVAAALSEAEVCRQHDVAAFLQSRLPPSA